MSKPKDPSIVLSATLVLRISQLDLAALNMMASRYPAISRNGIARAALRLGLAAIIRDPNSLQALPDKRRPSRHRTV